MAVLSSAGRTEADTIYALSSGAGIAGVAVIRISGPGAAQVLETMTPGPRPPPRRAQLSMIHRPSSEEPLDQGLLLWFPAPNSFTGEDLVELQMHGGRAVIAAVLEALGALPGFRLASPGEFTRRAFDADKLDLAEVEGLADLVNAETEAQRRQALRQMRGFLSVRCGASRAGLLAALALLEAEIDFAEDEVDVPSGTVPKIREVVAIALEDIRSLLAEAGRGERLREGLQVAIIGAPNVGKSSLLNALAQRDVAIVSDLAGTTRDLVEVHLDLAGLPVTLADTAGLREIEESRESAAIEAEGMRRTRMRAEEADLTLAVFDASRWPAVEPDVAALVDADSLVIVNKADLWAGDPGELAADLSEALAEPLRAAGNRSLPVSALTGEGLSGLLSALQEAAEARLEGGESALITRARHREALTDCCEALNRVQGTEDVELIAEDLRLALRALGRVVGEVDVEDLLDVIFREFCIGK